MTISDNYVTGDNIYLRELQNFFFEVLGMMSITHYGAVGDGRVDNYGPLQVAIDDAHRRGLNFLYVPYGRFIYTGELINIGDLIFMGNPHAHIVNIRTGEEIEIHQFGEGVTYTAGEGITIEGNVISATGGETYEAGDGITIEDSVISVNKTDTIINDGSKIPTSSAVYNYVDTMITQAIGGAY